MKPNKLADESIRAAKPADKPYKLSDGGGLYLYVTPSGGRLWRLKYRFDGKEKMLAFGSYPAVSLEEARERRDAARDMRKDGIDPGELAKLERARIRDESAKQKAATRFMLDSEGALSFRLGRRFLTLTPSETGELRAFLEATKAVQPKE